MSFEITNSDWYDYGFKHGREDAINACFGHPQALDPYFETAEQQHAYLDGDNDGYNSVDD